MVKQNIFKKMANSCYDKVINFSQTKDLGNLLMVTGAIGWAASSAAFTGAVALNEDIPKEQKRFLIPQEIADGVVNCTLFMGGTHFANQWAKKKIAKGELFPKGFEDVVEKARNAIGKDGLKNTLDSNDKVVKTVFEKIVDKVGETDLPKAEKLELFGKGFPALVSIVGSVLAANIITPIVRNRVASKIQDNYIQKTNTINYNQTKPNMNQTFARSLSMDQYLVKTRVGGMRV